MRRQLLSLLVLIGIMFGGVLAPTMAHARDVGTAHAAEILAFGDIMASSAHDPAEQVPDTQGPMASHHHCTIALEVEAPRVVLATMAPAIPPVRRNTRALASSAQAPPTQPPAA